jgi:DNA relaxase NicK
LGLISYIAFVKCPDEVVRLQLAAKNISAIFGTREENKFNNIYKKNYQTEEKDGLTPFDSHWKSMESLVRTIVQM